MENLVRIIKYYNTQALERAGVNVDSDTNAELYDAMADLDRHIKRLIREAIEDHVDATPDRTKPRGRPERKPETATDGPKSKRRWDDAHLR